jgi:KaiC/GvpD/RAD55 family RecA-like ATPase
MVKNAKPQESHPTASVERVVTGIPGLDQLMEGGFVKGAVILVTGGTGTGKTTFCAQFIWEGLRKGEPGVYITLEEDPEDIKEDLKRFGFNFERFEKEGKFKFVYQNPFEISDISSTIVDSVNKLNAKRIVLDPVSLIGMYMKDPAVIRKRLFEIIRLLKKTGATTIVTSEILENEIGERGGSLSRDGVSEFIVDGIIILNLFGIGEGIIRSLMIRKMRRTKHGTDVYPMEMGSNGIVLKK